MMKRRGRRPHRPVSRDIDVERAGDLLISPPRACLAATTIDGPWTAPVQLRWIDGRYEVGVATGWLPMTLDGVEAVLLVDEGIHWFELRAVYVRGWLRPVVAPSEPSTAWFELEPSRQVAWDYGQLREVDDGPAG
jgi:hypothetical protein